MKAESGDAASRCQEKQDGKVPVSRAEENAPVAAGLYFQLFSTIPGSRCCIWLLCFSAVYMKKQGISHTMSEPEPTWKTTV
ncbi:hypothetical protein STEG23_032141 [Scotinomys teguina]